MKTKRAEKSKRLTKNDAILVVQESAKKKLVITGLLPVAKAGQDFVRCSMSGRVVYAGAIIWISFQTAFRVSAWTAARLGRPEISRSPEEAMSDRHALNHA